MLFGVDCTVFCGEIERYGLNNTRWMGGVCDLDLCNGQDNIEYQYIRNLRFETNF